MPDWLRAICKIFTCLFLSVSSAGVPYVVFPQIVLFLVVVDLLMKEVRNSSQKVQEYTRQWPGHRNLPYLCSIISSFGVRLCNVSCNRLALSSAT